MRTQLLQYCAGCAGAANRQRPTRNIKIKVTATFVFIGILASVQSIRRLAPGSYSAGFIVLPEAVGRSQGQTSVLVQFLAAGPTHRMPLALHLDLGLQPKPFPLRSLWQCELCLPNFSGSGITGIETPGNIYLTVFPAHGK